MFDRKDIRFISRMKLHDLFFLWNLALFTMPCFTYGPKAFAHAKNWDRKPAYFDNKAGEIERYH